MDETLNMLAAQMDSMEEEDLNVAAGVWMTLHNYAACKRRAVRARLAGRITEAEREERSCEMYYKALPEWARW